MTKACQRRSLSQVKAGENVGVAMIRDFAHVIDREKAALGLFITLAEPTRAMKEGAASFGFYESLGTTIFPKLQILTIKGLLDGTKTARYPDLTRGGLTFKKAKKEKTEEQLTLGGEEPRSKINYSEVLMPDNKETWPPHLFNVPLGLMTKTLSFIPALRGRLFKRQNSPEKICTRVFLTTNQVQNRASPLIILDGTSSTTHKELAFCRIIALSTSLTVMFLADIETF